MGAASLTLNETTSQTPDYKPRAGFLGLLAALLLGYGLFGKSFAYLGYPPLYVGEVVLAVGTLSLLFSPSRWRGLRNRNLLPLMALMVWGCICTVPHIPRYGILSLRDSVIWGYGWFAVLIACFAVSAPPLVSRALTWYKGFVVIFVLLAPIVWLASVGTELLDITLGGTPISPIKGTETMVHLAGCVAFIYLQVRRMSLAWLLTVPIVLITGLNTRAGLLSFAVAVTLLFYLRPRAGKLALLAWILVTAITCAALFELRIDSPKLSRELSVDSISTGVASIFADAGSGQYDGTKRWRLEWWRTIIQYTVQGEYFWTGKGFGINLAESDGFTTDPNHSLRSPHNGHLTFLARAGVPGFLLWIGSQVFWVWRILHCYRQCLRRGPESLGKVFLFLIVYWSAFMVSAAFDVFLEGPMAGIWFWTLYGVGLACITLYERTVTLPPSRSAARTSAQSLRPVLQDQ